MLGEVFDTGVGLFVLTFAELYFKVLELNFFVDSLVLAVVTHVVLLLLVFLNHLAVVEYFAFACLDAALALFDVGGEIVNTGVKARYLVFKVLYGLRQLATDNLDAVNLGVDALQRVECNEAFLDHLVDIKFYKFINVGADFGSRGCFGRTLFCCHNLFIIYCFIILKYNYI